MTENASIRLTRTIASGPAAVWSALTDADKIAAWWAVGDVKAVVGHRFTLDMGAFGAQAFQGMSAGWPRILDRLEAFLAEG